MEKLLSHQAVRNKHKGKAFERELVDYFKDKGKAAKRSWGSDGRSLGLTEDVDVVVGHMEGETLVVEWKVQCKRKKALASYLQPSKNVTMVVTKQNNKPSLVIIELDKFMEIINDRKSLYHG